MEVLVLNAGNKTFRNRHMMTSFYRLIKAQRKQDSIYFIKTDSAARNIGNELAAVLNASEDSILSIYSGLSSMDRITKKEYSYKFSTGKRVYLEGSI